MVSVKANIDSVMSGMKGLERKAPRIIQMALNQTGRKIRTRARAELVQKMNPRKKSEVNKLVNLIPATQVSRVATIRVKEGHFGLEKTKDARVRSFRKKKRRVINVFFRGKQIKGAFRPKNLPGHLKDTILARQVPGKTRAGNRKFERLWAYSPLQSLAKHKIFRSLHHPTEVEFHRNFSRLAKVQADKMGL